MFCSGSSVKKIETFDGLRPVIFRLEATDEESVIDYVPVR